MLKLTHSFYRHSRFTYENFSCNTIVEHLTYISCRGKTCVTWNSQQPLLSLFVPTRLHSRLLATLKRRVRVKKPYVNINATKTDKQMSGSKQTSLTNCSVGQFEIYTEDGASNERPSASGNDNQQNYAIPPVFRIWEPVGENITHDDGFKFRVMSYNVLAQYLLECHLYLYTGCGSKNLNWKERAAKIYDEIFKLSPDILCLQEVQVSHLNSFNKKFGAMGYTGLFKQKTGQRQDGCAIYFKQSLFEMQDHISVEFYQPKLPILNRDNIGLIVKLAPKSSPNTSLVVATTHLLYNPKRSDVRLAQLRVLLAEIDRFAYIKNGNCSGSYLPLILTGDFNSTPDSAVVQLLDKGHVSASPFRNNSDWKKIGVTDNCQHLTVYLNRQKGVSTDFSMIKIRNSEYASGNTGRNSDPQQHSELFNSDAIGHPLDLTSVYHKAKNTGRFEATTFQDYWVTVDYIYFSGHKSLRLVERLRLPTTTECEGLGKLPNDRFGSDHFALAATFELKAIKSAL